jgi:oxygen-dependent protoporphyrinogen oxidase
MVSAMVTGIYGGDAKELSLEHCFPRMAAMEARYGSLFKALQAKKKQDPGASPMGPRGALTSFPEGIGRLPQHAADRLGAAIQYERRAQRIRREDGGFVIEAEGGETVRAEAVVIAAPAYAAGPMVSALDEACSRALSDIPYAGLAVLCTGYRRDQVEHRLDGFGFLVPRIEGLRALGCLWTSSIFPSQAPEDGVLLRTMFGGATDPAAVELSQDELLALLKQEVHPLLGISGEPELVRTFHQPRGIPQYVIGHGERLAAIEAAEEALPGLVFAGNAYRGIGLNECVVSALRAVKRVRERLSGGSR